MIEYITVKEASGYAGITTQAIYNLIEKQKIPHQIVFECGVNHKRIPIHQFLFWLKRDEDRHRRKADMLQQSQQALTRRLGGGN